MKKYAILIGSGLLIGFNEHIAYLGVLYIPLGTAMTIIYSAPIFTMIFSFVFLRIKQGLYKIFFALILIVGVLLVIRPPFIFHNLKPNVESYSIFNQTVTNNQTSPAKDHSETKDNIYWIGVAICVVAAACTGLISVVFNYLQDVDTGVAVFWSGCMTILCSFAFLSIDHDSHIFFTGNLNWTYMGELFALGSLGICAVSMVTISCQLLDPTINSVLRAQQVIFAFVAQTIVSQVLPYHLTFIGAGFVVLSAVCMPLDKYVKPKVPEKFRRFI
jgi:drug/metabolite transporter (DMT)-like permease